MLNHVVRAHHEATRRRVAHAPVAPLQYAGMNLLNHPLIIIIHLPNTTTNTMYTITTRLNNDKL